MGWRWGQGWRQSLRRPGVWGCGPAHIWSNGAWAGGAPGSDPLPIALPGSASSAPVGTPVWRGPETQGGLLGPCQGGLLWSCRSASPGQHRAVEGSCPPPPCPPPCPSPQLGSLLFLSPPPSPGLPSAPCRPWRGVLTGWALPLAAEWPHSWALTGVRAGSGPGPSHPVPSTRFRPLLRWWPSAIGPVSWEPPALSPPPARLPPSPVQLPGLLGGWPLGPPLPRTLPIRLGPTQENSPPRIGYVTSRPPELATSPRPNEGCDRLHGAWHSLPPACARNLTGNQSRGRWQTSGPSFLEPCRGPAHADRPHCPLPHSKAPPPGTSDLRAALPRSWGSKPELEGSCCVPVQPSGSWPVASARPTRGCQPPCPAKPLPSEEVLEPTFVQLIKGGAWEGAPGDCWGAANRRSSPGHGEAEVQGARGEGLNVVLRWPQHGTRALGRRPAWLSPGQCRLGHPLRTPCLQGSGQKYSQQAPPAALWWRPKQTSPGATLPLRAAGTSLERAVTP